MKSNRKIIPIIIYIILIIVINALMIYANMYVWFISLCNIYGAFDSFSPTTISKIIGVLTIILSCIIPLVIDFSVYKLFNRKVELNKYFRIIPIIITFLLNLYFIINLFNS